MLVEAHLTSLLVILLGTTTPLILLWIRTTALNNDLHNAFVLVFPHNVGLIDFLA